LREALQGSRGQVLPITRTHPGHLSPAFDFSYPPTRDPIRPAYERNDGNDVSLDREAMLLTRTQGNYQLSAQFAQGELRKLLQSIREGGRT
jgi:flagellar basal body rod protein FlgB